MGLKKLYEMEFKDKMYVISGENLIDLAHAVAQEILASQIDNTTLTRLFKTHNEVYYNGYRVPIDINLEHPVGIIKGLTKRTFNALCRFGKCKTIKDVLDLNGHEFGVRQLGKDSISNLKQSLAAMGIEDLAHG